MNLLSLINMLLKIIYYNSDTMETDGKRLPASFLSHAVAAKSGFAGCSPLAGRAAASLPDLIPAQRPAMWPLPLPLPLGYTSARPFPSSNSMQTGKHKISCTRSLQTAPSGLQIASSNRTHEHSRSARRLLCAVPAG